MRKIISIKLFAFLIIICCNEVSFSKNGFVCYKSDTVYKFHKIVTPDSVSEESIHVKKTYLPKFQKDFFEVYFDLPCRKVYDQNLFYKNYYRISNDSIYIAYKGNEHLTKIDTTKEAFLFSLKDLKKKVKYRFFFGDFSNWYFLELKYVKKSKKNNEIIYCFKLEPCNTVSHFYTLFEIEISSKHGILSFLYFDNKKNVKLKRHNK